MNLFFRSRSRRPLPPRSQPDLRRSAMHLASSQPRSTERPHDQYSLLATDSVYQCAINETPLVELEIDRIGFAQRAFFTAASRRLRDCARGREEKQERE